METSELNKLLAQGEGVRIEFKEAQGAIPSSFYDSVASFLNREGGVILLGVTDDARVLGLERFNIGQLKQDVVTALNNPDVIAPPFPLAVQEVKHQSHTLLYVRIPVSSQVHKHGTVIYDRVNDSDIRVESDAYISEMYARKRTVYSENQIFTYLKIADLDQALFDELRQRIAAVHTNHPWLMATNERILRDARFYRRDFQTGEEGLTLAAALVFGTDAVIGNILPAYRFEILERRVDLDRYDDRLALRTNLIHTYLSALEFIKKKWKEKFFTEDGVRKDLRELIFRELVANVIIHREYSQSTPSEIVIYEDRVVATNPNRPRFSGPLRLDTFDAEPKNPNIRAFFNVLNWADELGSGVKNMNKYVSVYSGGAHPSFVEGDKFTSIIPLLNQRISDKYSIYLHLANISEKEMKNIQTDVLMQLPLDLRLKHLSDNDEIALSLVKGWAEKSKDFAEVRFLTGVPIEVSELKKVGSWKEKSSKLLKKRARVLLATLVLCLIPATLDQLAETLGYKSKDRYRDDYIKPLKNNGLLAYTKEEANDPNQAYILTDRGKSFLGGSIV